jgi:hypothetical protein
MYNMKYDISVALLTICRESLLRAVRSVFRQSHKGNIQILIGVDRDPTNRAQEYQTLLSHECPDNVKITWLDVGYSTSKKYGGVHNCSFGGSLRSALTFLANSEYVMYLDDDDWLKEEHVELVLKAIQGKKWAFSYSIYADSDRSIGICVDEIESVGVNRGVYKDKFGGFVRPSGLLIDKMQLLHLVHLWSCAPFPNGDGEDRLIFENLRKESHGCTQQATVYASIDPRDGMHQLRLKFINSKGIAVSIDTKHESIR